MQRLLSLAIPTVEWMNVYIHATHIDKQTHVALIDAEA